MKDTILQLAIITLFLSLIMTAVGGYKNLMRTHDISEAHAWNDGTYLALVSIALLLLARNF